MDSNTSDWNSRLVAWFNRNTQLAVLSFLALLIGGSGAYLSLRREGFPSPEIPVAVVTATYRGASPEEIEKQIVKPIEAAAATVANVKEVRSSAANSFGSVVVSFEVGTNFQGGLSELRNKIQSAGLPSDADRPEITVPSIDGNSSYYAIAGDLPLATLRERAEAIQREVESVREVKEFTLLDTIRDRVVVRWRPAELTASGLTPLQVQQALVAGNVTIPAGTLTVDSRIAPVVTNASLTSIDQIAALVVGQHSQTGLPVRLADVADVTAESASSTVVTKVGDRINTTAPLTIAPALSAKLSFRPNADLLTAAHEVDAVFARIAADPTFSDTRVVTVYDTAASVQEQIDEIVAGAIGEPIGSGSSRYLGYLFGGIWLIIFTMLAFVSWRAALISATAIPLSLLFTFLSLQVMGITLNTLTLFSMILVLGLIVDPAIVVLEAIQREIDLGHHGKDAVMRAMTLIGNGLFMAVATSILAFVPFGVVSGIFGEIIRYIPLTVVPALLASYFVPLFFLTFLAQRFLKPARLTDTDEVGSLWRFARWLIQANRAILNRRWLQATIILATTVVPLGVTGFLFATQRVTPVQFSTPNDSQWLNLQAEYPTNLPLSEKQAIAAQLEPILAAEPAVDSFAPSQQTESGFTLSLHLIPRAERGEDSTVVIDRLRTALIPLIDQNAKRFFSVSQVGVGIPTSSFPVSVNIYGDDLASLKAAAVQTGDLLRSERFRGTVTRVEDGYTDVAAPQIAVTIDRARAERVGLSGIQLAQSLAGIIGESTVTRFDQTVGSATRRTEVILASSASVGNAEALGNLIIAAGPGGPIRLQDVATVSQREGVSQINRLDGSRFVTVQAQVADPLTDAAEPQKAIKEYWTPERLAAVGLRSDALEDKGSGNEFVESFRELFIALGVAILLTYIFLVVFFKSFTQPFIILFAVPLSFVGVFPALAVIGGQFGFLEILGLITIIGIVENVGIFYIDLANRKRADGLTSREAITLASGIRLRPIILTKITALGGLLPLIVISPIWRSLAIVAVAGILVSGILSLFTTPILYVWHLELKERLQQRRLRRASRIASL